MKNLKNLLLFFPAINIIADFLFVFEPLQTSITFIRGSILILVLLYFMFGSATRVWMINKAIILMFVYFLILLFQSSDISFSLPFFLKFFSSIVMFPAFYLLITSIKDLNKVKQSILVTVFVFVLNFVFAELFNLGGGVYSKGEGDFQTGNITASGLYTGSLLLVSAPLFYTFLKTNRVKIIYIFLNISTILMLILSLRRTALLMVVIGYVVIGFYYRKVSKLYRYGILVAVFTGIIITVKFEKIQSRIDVRSDRFEKGSIEKEGRYIDTILINTKIFSFEDLGYSLFGKEFFNSPGSYGYPDPKRVIHVDYNIILSGSGLIGLILYITFNYRILIIFLRQKINSKKSTIHYLIWVTGLAIFTISIATSFSSGLFAVTYRSTLYALLGSFVAVLNKEIIPLRNISNLKGVY